MSDQTKVPGSTGDKRKAERLAKALRENLKRRKLQARAQSQPGTPEVEADENAQDSGEK